MKDIQLTTASPNNIHFQSLLLMDDKKYLPFFPLGFVGDFKLGMILGITEDGEYMYNIFDYEYEKIDEIIFYRMKDSIEFSIPKMTNTLSWDLIRVFRDSHEWNVPDNEMSNFKQFVNDLKNGTFLESYLKKRNEEFSYEEWKIHNKINFNKDIGG